MSFKYKQDMEKAIHNIYTSCPRCSYVLSSHSIEYSVVCESTQCRHLGFDALSLCLLLKKRTHFFHLLSLSSPHRPISHGSLFSHVRLWPTPYFESFDSLVSFLLWAQKAYSSSKLFEKQHVEDRDIYNLLFPSPDVGIQWISSEKGFGVTARRPIPRHHRVGIYAGLIRPFRWREIGGGGGVSHEYVASLPTSTRLVFPFLPPNWVVDATESGSIARYINHDIEPSLAHDLLFWRGIPLISLVTQKYIEQGEELTLDYGSQYWKKKGLIP